eukprot:scaffold673914_cov46-Prasinocladus_malaysianus.AAC.1
MPSGNTCSGSERPGSNENGSAGTDQGPSDRIFLRSSSSSASRQNAQAETEGLRRHQSLPQPPEDFAFTEVEPDSQGANQAGMRRSASDGDLSSDPTTSASQGQTGSILHSIAEQGSTAWMLMPDDDMFGQSALSPMRSSPAKAKSSRRRR